MDKEERLIIWRALSELFLDAELNESANQLIANTVYETKLPLSIVEHILWQEVFPVLSQNLNSVAGVWDGWSDDWLLSNLNVCETIVKGPNRYANTKDIQESWEKVCFHLQKVKGD